MKKLVILVLITFFLLTGYTFPQKPVYYIKGNCTLGNNVTIYIPYNSAYMFDVNGNKVVNVYSSSVTGYTESGYTVTFPTFNDPYYRPSNTSQQVTVTWSSITDYRLPQDGVNNQLGVIMVCSCLLIVIILLIKR